MRVVDAHVHLWHPKQTPRAVTGLVKLLGFSPRAVDWVARRVFPRTAQEFFATPEHITRPYMPPDYDRDCRQHDVRGLVHIEASWEGKGPLGPVGETAWLDGLSPSGSGRIEAIVGHVDLRATNVAEVLKAHRAASTRVRGMRDTLAWHASDRIFDLADSGGLCGDPRWRAGFEQLQQHGLSFEATCYDSQLDELGSLARAYPQQPIVLCHLGTPIAAGGPFGGLGRTPAERQAIVGAWRDAMARLAACPNVHVKLSGLAMPVCGFGWEHRAAPPSVDEVVDAFAPFVKHAIETFGVERCFFGSNFPIDKVSLPYATLLEAMLTIARDRSDDERRRLFETNAARFYRIDDRDS